MYCNRCGSQLDPNSTFCTTCGNAVASTVVPQTDNTVVPTNGTVVPTVVPQNSKSNVTITSIIIVLVLFIGAGIVGILLLKNTKASSPVNNENTQIAMDNITSAVTSSSTTAKKTNSWATSSQRVDNIETTNSYSVNGLKIYIPEGYTPSYTNNILTVVNNNGINYYIINVVSVPYDSVDLETFKNNLIASGYTIKSFVPGTYMDRSGIKIDVSFQGYDYTCYVLKANSSKVALFLFDKGTTEETATALVNYSLM